jgi:hypothetical protein
VNRKYKKRGNKERWKEEKTNNEKKGERKAE